MYFTGIQFVSWKTSVDLVRGKFSRASDPGEVTHFQALSSAVSGTVGLGNIAGVGAAVTLGGPGATFWMIIAGLLGNVHEVRRVHPGREVPRGTRPSRKAHEVTAGDNGYVGSSGSVLIFGLVLAILVGAVIIGGISSIARVTSRLAPAALGEIIYGAFAPEGVAFSNEAGVDRDLRSLEAERGDLQGRVLLLHRHRQRHHLHVGA